MSEHLKFFTETQITLIGFYIFIAVFAARVIWTFLPSQVKINKYLSELPLEKTEEQ